ncbi:outer membrane protein TolC [Natronospira proteinivora]|uniref:Outer membrane protein TolC n=1 Tax=Natronospira proteinivora TaxID=1807133 RepID=A0ABT1G8A5_9GAMM|nr:TolC family protein [Natronospira proteinivora]MCP1727556.1 outer membrane protein TolC [Natronospira proteinivora]
MKLPFLMALLMAVAVLLPPTLAAQNSVLDMAEAEERALARDAGLDELRARVEATRDSAVAQSALPDPEITVGLQNLPVDSFNLNEDRMSSLMIGARQRFPAGESRTLSRERGMRAAEALEAEVSAREREVLRQVRRAWVAWAYTRQQLMLAREESADFEALVEVTRSRYRSGLGSQRDLSRSRLELAAVEERILTLESEQAAARAELARWVGSLASGTEPGQADLPMPKSLTVMNERLLEHPSLQAEAHRLKAAETEVDLARQSYRPEWMMEGSYGHRRASDMDGGRASDMASLMVGFSLPLFTRDRQDRVLSASRSEAQAVHYRRMDQIHVLQGELESEYARYQRRLELADLYESSLLAEAAENLELEFSAYRADRGDFRDVIRARVDELDYRLRLLNVQQQIDESRIELDYLAGESR